MSECLMEVFADMACLGQVYVCSYYGTGLCMSLCMSDHVVVSCVDMGSILRCCWVGHVDDILGAHAMGSDAHVFKLSVASM